jgi:hypothetical protein
MEAEEKETLTIAKKRAEDILDLAGHPKWKVFTDDLQQAFDDSNNVFMIQDEKALYQMQGRLTTLKNIIETREIASSTIDQIEELLAAPEVPVEDDF